MIRYAVPFYFLRGGWTGVVFAAFCFWTALAFAGTLQWYPAIRLRLEKRPVRALKKCVLVFIDNPLFCLGSFFTALVFAVLLISCPSWSLLYLDQALRLRLLKYDWLDKQNGEGKADSVRIIPWAEILSGEMEKTGNALNSVKFNSAELRVSCLTKKSTGSMFLYTETSYT